MNSYHYGMDATKKNIEDTHSRRRKYNSRIFLNLFKFFFIVLLFLVLTGAGIGAGIIKGIIDNAPDVDPFSFGPSGFATKVYDSQGNLTDTLVMSGSNREAATYDELPQDLIDAFVAIEDARFWSHNGIDLRSIARAAVGVLTDDYAGGGSTLTQQLIKNNVFEGGRETSFGARMERKFQEQYLAVKLEQALTEAKGSQLEAKKQIITDYLNTINLGNNSLGVKVAAKRYFNKEVSELTLSECTVIAGITQNPVKLNPISGQEKNAEKRKVILQYMVDQGYIDKSEQEAALADDVYARIQDVDLLTKETTSPYSYFTDELIDQVMDALMEQLGYSNTQAYNLLFGGGLSIYTTQDPEIQAIVDEEVNSPDNYDTVKYSVEYRLSVTHADGTTEHFSEKDLESYHQNVLQDKYDGLYPSEDEARADVEAYKAYQLKETDKVLAERFQTILQPQASFVLMDQATGQVKALCGGRGEKTASRTLNRATNVPRQPGSVFKVVSAFAPALDACGATLGTVYYDAPFTVGTKTFRNWYGESYLGYSSIRDGIIYSMNIVAVRALMETVTPQLGVEYAKNMGITTLTDKDFNAATALGGLTNGVTNLDLTASFAAIANGGTYTKPQFFTKILNHDGKVLLQMEPETHRALKDSTAFLLTDAMSASMQSNRKFARPGVNVNSTSTRAALPNMSAAGKSGTTTANNDIWFVGFTPYYTAGVWGGCDDNQKLKDHNTYNGGTSFHKDIWRKIMTRVHEGLADPGFTPPESIETAVICRKSGKLAVNGVCDQDPRGNATYTEYFARGTVPTEVCDKHVVATVCSASGQMPTEYCPEKRTEVCMALPQNETGATDDSVYALPGFCTIHTSISTILPTPGEEIESTAPQGPAYNPNWGPGYVPTTPAAPIDGGASGPGSR
ncbi:MAG: transglycosylase domain-containing protein [Lachnospiraceae bacterium]|nr:transglycosylase domain-containing protein [Lachnospiraceae bacterium]